MSNVTKDELFDGLHKILTSKIANTRFYGARCLGFRSEIEFGILARRKGWNLLDGGQCLFTWIDWPDNRKNSIDYVTVSFDSPERYVQAYSKLAKLSIFRDGFFVKIRPMDEWSSEEIIVKNRVDDRVSAEIPKPKFEFLKYSEGVFENSQLSEILDSFPKKNPMVCRKKAADNLNYIKNYHIDDIASVYANRFFLDMELGHVRKSMIDFDGILENNQSYTVVETKEKDPLKEDSDREDWFFGWDSRRLGWFLYLKEEIGFDTLYVIREVDNQTSRKFVAWKGISLRGFCEHASWLTEHGGGGGSGTITAPYLEFKDL